MSEKQPNLIYAWDAYCGWCYGFSQSLRSFHERHPELPLTVLSGGLFVGERKQPIGAFTHIPEANNRISELTGAVFGTAYEELLQDGTTIMDSGDAAVGFAALRSLAPERAVNLASAMQRSFYHSGKSLSDPETYREIAVEFNLDPEDLLARLKDTHIREAAQEDFNIVHQLGVQSYPTLILQTNEQYIKIGGGAMTVEKLEANLSAIMG